jgi:hypothetical protein
MERQSGVPAPSKELPATSASLSALRMMCQAHLRTMSRRRGERFIRELALVVSREESVRTLMPTRPREQRAAQEQAQDEAAQWIRLVLPILLSSLPDE